MIQGRFETFEAYVEAKIAVSKLKPYDDRFEIERKLDVLRKAELELRELVDSFVRK